MVTASPCIDLVLASSSRYRRELLARLFPSFRAQAPDIDESPEPNEAAAVLARRLARSKALIVATRCPGAVVIGSDQVASLDGELLGKPGSAHAAFAQLSRCSGRTVEFLTALTLIDGRDGRQSHALDSTRVVFRHLGAPEIEAYIAREQPFDCAGSFKAEGLGIALFDRIESVDPTALVGLPLIALCGLLREAGIPVIG